MSQWNTWVMELAEGYKELFFKMDGDTFLHSIGHNKSVVDCFMFIYNLLVREEKIIPIERLGIVEKNNLWEEAKRVSEIQDKEHLIKVSKAIHCLGSYIQL